jgi:hypothetical protein
MRGGCIKETCDGIQFNKSNNLPITNKAQLKPDDLQNLPGYCTRMG